MSGSETKPNIKAVLFALSEGWGIAAVGTLRDATLIEKKGWIWSLCDNGGEYNLDIVNGESFSGIAYTRDGLALGNWTIAYRLAMRILGEPINWTYEIEDEDFAFLDSQEARP